MTAPQEAGTYVRAIALGNGGTRANRSPEEHRAWAARVRAIAMRADEAMLAHGAVASDLVRERVEELSDTIRAAARSFFATLTEEQREAIKPASRSGTPTPGTVLDLFESASVDADGHVRAFDEYVPCAEALWPEVCR